MPSKVAIAVETQRHDQRVERARRISALAASDAYHFSEKPDHAVGRPAFVEGQRHQHGDRDVEEGEDQVSTSQSERRVAGERSAIGVISRLCAPARGAIGGHRLQRSAAAS